MPVTGSRRMRIWEAIIRTQATQMDHHIDRVMASVTSGTAAARSKLAASWQRSYQKYGLDPALRRDGTELDVTRLRYRREEFGRMLAVAGPKLDSLFAMVGHCGCGVLLTDAEGLVLDSRVGEADAAEFRRWGLEAGTDWSEAHQGTNGIGTCLAERRALTIHRDQHFMANNTSMSCVDAPLFGPDAQLIGALDVSSARADQTEDFNRLIEAMVSRVAQQIETELFRTAFPSHRIVLAAGQDPQGSALLAVNRDDLVEGATRSARKLLGLEQSGRITPRPLADLIEDEDPRGLQGAERAAVIRALARGNGNVSEAARTLGLSRATMYRRMKRLGITDADR